MTDFNTFKSPSQNSRKWLYFNDLCNMNTKSSIAFYCRKCKANAAGLASIEVVVTIGGERLTSTLPRRCTPQDFEKSIKSRAQNPIKEYLAVVSEKIEALKTRCLIEGICLSKDILRTSIQYGFAEHHYTVGQLFSIFLESQENKVTIAIFESINYFCSHDHYWIVVDECTLQSILKYPISIDWSKYKSTI